MVSSGKHNASHPKLVSGSENRRFFILDKKYDELRCAPFGDRFRQIGIEFFRNAVKIKIFLNSGAFLKSIPVLMLCFAHESELSQKDCARRSPCPTPKLTNTVRRSFSAFRNS